MARDGRKQRRAKVWIQRELDLLTTSHDVPDLGAGRPRGLYACFGPGHRTMARISHGNYSERLDRRAEVLGA